MQLGAGVLGPRQAAGAEADRRHVEVAAVLLHQQVGSRLRSAEEGVRGAIDRHRRVDPLEPGVIPGQLEPGVELLQRQPVGCVAVDLVGGAEHEGGVGAEATRCLQQVERAVGVHAEVRLRLAGGPVVGGLRGGVDDELDRGRRPRRRRCRPRTCRGCPPPTSGTRRSGRRDRRSPEPWTPRGRRTGHAGRTPGRSRPSRTRPGAGRIRTRRAPPNRSPPRPAPGHPLPAVATPNPRVSRSSSACSSIQAARSPSVSRAVRDGRQSVRSNRRVQSET